MEQEWMATAVAGAAAAGRAGAASLSLSACILRVYQMRGRKKGRENTCLHFQAARFRKRERRRGYAVRNECASVFRKHLPSSPLMITTLLTMLTTNRTRMRCIRLERSKAEANVLSAFMVVRGSDMAFLPPHRRGVLSITIFRVL